MRTESNGLSLVPGWISPGQFVRWSHRPAIPKT